MEIMFYIYILYDVAFRYRNPKLHVAEKYFEEKYLNMSDSVLNAHHRVLTEKNQCEMWET